MSVKYKLIYTINKITHNKTRKNCILMLTHNIYGAIIQHVNKIQSSTEKHNCSVDGITDTLEQVNGT